MHPMLVYHCFKFQVGACCWHGRDASAMILLGFYCTTCRIISRREVLSGQVNVMQSCWLCQTTLTRNVDVTMAISSKPSLTLCNYECNGCFRKALVFIPNTAYKHSIKCISCVPPNGALQWISNCSSNGDGIAENIRSCFLQNNMAYHVQMDLDRKRRSLQDATPNLTESVANDELEEREFSSVRRRRLQQRSSDSSLESVMAHISFDRDESQHASPDPTESPSQHASTDSLGAEPSSIT